MQWKSYKQKVLGKLKIGFMISSLQISKLSLNVIVAWLMWVPVFYGDNVVSPTSGGPARICLALRTAMKLGSKHWTFFYCLDPFTLWWALVCVSNLSMAKELLGQSTEWRLHGNISWCQDKPHFDTVSFLFAGLIRPPSWTQFRLLDYKLNLSEALSTITIILKLQPSLLLWM